VSTSTVIAVGGLLVLLLLVVMLAALLASMRAASTTIAQLADRLGGLEERTVRLQREIADVDGGLGDVAAALREHRTDAATPLPQERDA
jgi:cell division protein FtsB